jgi:hypothetical protein
MGLHNMKIRNCLLLSPRQFINVKPLGVETALDKIKVKWRMVARTSRSDVIFVVTESFGNGILS